MEKKSKDLTTGPMLGIVCGLMGLVVGFKLGSLCLRVFFSLLFGVGFGIALHWLANSAPQSDARW